MTAFWDDHMCITILHSEKWNFKIPSPLGLMIISYISNRPDHAEVKHQDKDMNLDLWHSLKW